MAKAIILEEHGGPEQLRVQPVDVGTPGPGEIRLRQTAIGVNFHDIYVRTGLYKTLPLPGVPGIEAVGVVEAVGEGVQNVRTGDRIGYVAPDYGTYASDRLLEARRAIALPDGIADAPMAATLMKALTAAALVQHVHRVGPSQTILVQAAAGGMGQLLCSWARHLGATVIGTVGSKEKAAVAQAAGAHHVILYREEDVVARVRDITAGRGVAAAYDSIGADTFLSSIDCLGFFGRLVSFGQASGPVEPFTPSLLATRSLSVSRPVVFHYLQDAGMFADLTRSVFDAFASGAIKPIEPVRFSLEEAPAAHTLLESGKSPGGVVLIP